MSATRTVKLARARFPVRSGWSAKLKLEKVRAPGPRSCETAGLLIKSRHPSTSLLLPRDRIGCRTLSPYDSSRCLPKEHSLYFCGSLVLHVGKDVSIGI